MMTQRDFEIVAKAIASVTWPISDQSIDIIEALAAAFKTDNPNFNRERFVKACYSHEVATGLL